MLGCFSKLKRVSSNQTPPPKFSPTDSGEPTPDLFKSFNSLFEPIPDPPSQTLTLTLASPPSLPDRHPISSAIASGRLFSASPGLSNSIIDSPAVIIRVGSAGVAVSTYSPDPYSDFRQSMEEMAAALGISGGRTRLDVVVLRELLFCYLALNRKHAHGYIVSAFADLLASFSGPGDEKQVVSE